MNYLFCLKKLLTHVALTVKCFSDEIFQLYCSTGQLSLTLNHSDSDSDLLTDAYLGVTLYPDVPRH